jgi:hypothetical protein
MNNSRSFYLHFFFNSVGKHVKSVGGRDRLICGINDSNLRERLLRVADLDTVCVIKL